MPVVRLFSFGPFKRDDWIIKVSSAFDQVIVIAYHQTKYQGTIQCFTNEIEAVMYVEYLIKNGTTPSNFIE